MTLYGFGITIFAIVQHKEFEIQVEKGSKSKFIYYPNTRKKGDKFNYPCEQSQWRICLGFY